MTKEIVLHVGLDDTDHLEGGCTTYLATLLCGKVQNSLHFIDYPNLVRLNPNVPFKTRGNGAIALRLKGIPHDIREFKKIAKDLLMTKIKPNDHAQPGLVFLEGRIPFEMHKFYKKALNKVVTIKEALKIAQESKANIESLLGFSGNRGIVGALAAIGWGLSTPDYTFELIAYRVSENWKAGPRRINPDSVVEMDRRFSGTFGNLDPLNREIKIAPHGPDPVLCGIRANNPEELLNAWNCIIISEIVSELMLFRSNQGTDVHFQKETKIREINQYESVLLRGTLVSYPKREIGGHLFFRLQSDIDVIQCAAYEPTRQFRDRIELLKPGDEILAFGGIRPATKEHPMTLNLEKLKVINLTKSTIRQNPVCSFCNGRLKSAGKNKGYKCKHCSSRFPNLKPEPVILPNPRKIKEGEWIQPPARAWRHLTKPFSRSLQGSIWIPDPQKIDQWIKHGRFSLLNSYLAELR